MDVLIVVGVSVLLVAIVVITMYNGLVAARQHVRESWSGVDTELKRRHDLVPNLVATVKGYATHERETLERVVQLRQSAEALRSDLPGKDLAVIEGQLAAALSRLVVRLEAYPTLKADQSFLALQAELANTEDRIQGALRFYNGNVRELNVKCESFPSNLIASMFGFATANYFELKDSAERAVPLVVP